MTSSELDLVLGFADERTAYIRKELDAVIAAGRVEDQQLRSLEERLTRQGLNRSTDAEPCSREPQGDTERHGWDELVRSAREYFEARGIDSSTVTLDDLIDSDEAAEIKLISTTTASFTCRLDLTDLVIATVAGLTASAVDATIVRIPKSMTYAGEHQGGSSLTELLRSKAVPADNLLADRFRVPFDSMNPDHPDIRLSPRTHRADTFGHDPLVGLVMGVIDILRGTSTGVARDGEMFVREIANPATTNPLAALVIELGHLLSDVGTRSGLPLPGWSLLRLLDLGNVDGQTVSELARTMYLRGFDSWHLVSMSVSVSASDLALRAGWGLRYALDDDWAQQRDQEALLIGSTKTATHPRFIAMSLLAASIACAGNASKIAAYGGNPLAWNAAQWARFARLVPRWWKSQPRSAADAIVARSNLNLAALADGWDGLLS